MADSTRVGSPPATPVLIFDGDCGFCRYWIARWRLRSGDAVEYVPFQDPALAQRFPEVPRERCRRAVQLVQPDGRVVEGALAVFEAMAFSGRRLPLWTYQHVPGAAAVSERSYRFVADHRAPASRLTAFLWGRDARVPSYALAGWLFLRLLGIVYLVAFWSLAVQTRGLIGHDGILPAGEYIAAVTRWADAQHVGLDRFRVLPTLFWFGTSDRFLEGLSVGGAALAALLVVGVAPALLLPLLWLGYLSATVVFQDFLSYQWDTLLLETGLLAIFAAPLSRWDRLRRAADPPRIARWLLWWLLFRLMFGSGIVKLASGDPTWRGLDALAYHYETQPIPTPVAWFAHHLPLWFQKGSTAVVLGFELALPWCMFAPRRLRTLACAVLVGLQTLIALSGNYAFFNLLTIALCLLLLDDATLQRIAPVLRRYSPAEQRETVRGARWPAWTLAAVTLVTVPVSIVMVTSQLGVSFPGAAIVAPLASFVDPFRSVNRYGLFAVMTTTRPEIIVEGSDDGVTWRPYEFKYKAGDVRRGLSWVAPHQPRLDWQMWFAALGRYDSEFWFQSFCARLLDGSPSVRGLLAYDPFQGRPPRWVRGVFYQYHFADAATRAREGVWWTRERLGLYSPALSLGQTTR